jgi:methyl-accepting chemotaxis protein|nr:hypothetical protein [Kofleriaceae bacterium]
MPKSSTSPLAVAAASFDDALATYARLAELFLKTPLTSVKHLERANATLNDLAACEPVLQQAAQALLVALGDARGRQEGLAQDVVAHAPTLQKRNEELHALMQQMAQVATEVGEVNATIATGPDVAEVSGKVLELSKRAEQLAETARDTKFEEVATQAHALHQRLLAIGKTLQRVVPN